jgi:hypothetical protein
LTERQQIDWAAPTTILKKCPIFTSATPPDPNRLTPAERDRQQLAAALEENNQLKRQLSQRQDGDTYDPRTTPADEMARTIFGQLQPYRGKASRFGYAFMKLVKARREA